MNHFSQYYILTSSVLTLTLVSITEVIYIPLDDLVQRNDFPHTK